ncbi:RNA polymerase-binding protein DksA [Ottowia thiooxydans]|uniref:RNA polymerase-binding protein DksA n=1 Tax=Ottowia thiooxydans TaxID=219182 RepID=UPI0004049F08|nr:RNA polymerase-binding protein DksA [Ottowia thiooxydans]
MKSAAAKSTAKTKAPPSKAVPAKASAAPSKVPAAAKTPSPPKVARAPAPAKSAPAKTGALKTIRPTATPTAADLAPAAPKNLPMPIVASQPVPTPIKKDMSLANNWKTKTPAELTDAEIIAMPDSEYMSDKQMAFFRLKLVRLKDDIHANAGQTTENLREDTVVVPDPADRATIEEEHALELRTRDRERKLLKKIEQSISRIDSGDYGYCDETGEPIGVGRLLARPTATLSLEAQQRRELKQKMFGD